MTEKTYSKVNLFLRSFIFSIFSLISITFTSASCACMFGWMPVRYRHAFIRSHLRLYFVVLKFICHMDYQVEGRENISKQRNGIVLSKHQSTWETFFLPILFHDPAIILKRELYWIPIFGWGLAASKPIAINRHDSLSAMQQVIEKGKKYLEDGRWILVFPEGTRIPFGRVGHYRLGGARLAAATGYPIIPVAHDAGRYWPKRSFIKRPGTVRVVIGPPIESQGRSAEDILRLAKNWIETTMREMT